MDMMGRLAAIESRYEELNEAIADPSALSDMDNCTRLTKEHAEVWQAESDAIAGASSDNFRRLFSLSSGWPEL